MIDWLNDVSKLVIGFLVAWRLITWYERNEWKWNWIWQRTPSGRHD